MERRKDLDFAKGIGIILMVLGRCYSEGNGGALKIWFYSFHMPLFFLVSGMLAQSKERIPFRRFLCKWARSLLLPYFIWGIAAALYLSIMGRRSLDYFLGCLMQVATLQGLSAMWFLPCLFFAEILFYIGRVLYERNRDLGWGGIVLVSAIGFFCPPANEYIEIILRSCTGVFFLWLGWLFAKPFSQLRKSYIWVIAFVLHLILSRLNGQVDMLGRVYGNYVLFCLDALMGTWLTIQLYQLLAAARLERYAEFATWFGRNSIVLVCTSLYAIDILRLVDYKLFGNILPRLGSAEGILLCTLALSIEFVVIIVCKKTLWFTFGKSRPDLKSNNVGQ